MKSIAFLGTGKIALEYSKIIRRLGHKVQYASSSSENSKSWKKFKATNPKVKFMPTEKILKHKEINKIFALLPYLKQMEYFPKFLNSKKNIFIEKPFFYKSKKFSTLLQKNKKHLKNKYISFNRRFYTVVNILKQRVKKKDIKFIRVNISENFSQKTKSSDLKYKSFQKSSKFWPGANSSSQQKMTVFMTMIVCLNQKIFQQRPQFKRLSEFFENLLGASWSDDLLVKTTYRPHLAFLVINMA